MSYQPPSSRCPTRHQRHHRLNLFSTPASAVSLHPRQLQCSVQPAVSVLPAAQQQQCVQSTSSISSAFTTSTLVAARSRVFSFRQPAVSPHPTAAFRPITCHPASSSSSSANPPASSSVSLHLSLQKQQRLLVPSNQQCLLIQPASRPVQSLINQLAATAVIESTTSIRSVSQQQLLLIPSSNTSISSVYLNCSSSFCLRLLPSQPAASSSSSSSNPPPASAVYLHPPQ